MSNEYVKVYIHCILINTFKRYITKQRFYFLDMFNFHGSILICIYIIIIIIVIVILIYIST